MKRRVRFMSSQLKARLLNKHKSFVTQPFYLGGIFRHWPLQGWLMFLQITPPARQVCNTKFIYVPTTSFYLIDNLRANINNAASDTDSLGLNEAAINNLLFTKPISRQIWRVSWSQYDVATLTTAYFGGRVPIDALTSHADAAGRGRRRTRRERGTILVRQPDYLPFKKLLLAFVFSAKIKLQGIFWWILSACRFSVPLYNFGLSAYRHPRFCYASILWSFDITLWGCLGCSLERRLDTWMNVFFFNVWSEF